MNNLPFMIQLLKSRNPQELALSMVKTNNINDPTINSLIQLAQEGKTDEFVNLAQQMFQSHGKDLNTEYQNFMKNLK